MKLKTRQRITYLLADLVMTTLAMLVFNVLRYKYFITDDIPTLGDFLRLKAVVKGIILLPWMMMAIYYLSGCYSMVVYRSRVDEFLNTLYTTLIGAVLIFFFVVANDSVHERGVIFEIILALWGVMFGCVYIARLAITIIYSRRLHSRRVGFATLIVGSSQSAVNMANKLNSMRKSMGFNIVGYVKVDENMAERRHDLPVYDLADIHRVCARLSIINLIIMPHPDGLHATMQLINKLFPLGLHMYVQPMLWQVISGRSAFHNIAGEPLVDISRPDIPPSTSTIKRATDVVISIIALAILSPVLLFIAIAVKCDSRGPIFYTQERVGYRKKLFKIIKFRTMRTDAEENGPALSSPGDPRITKVGSFLRKYRLDELPQFVNVLKGEMSIVGPRPERPYYVDRIVERVPYYSLVHSVRPGITSWGMVKYGYATSIDQMIDRLRYDLLYIENVSTGVDIKIIIYTFKTIITGKGL